MADPVDVPGLLPGETAYTLSLSDTDPTDTALAVVRVIRTTDPNVVAGVPVPVLRVDAYEVDADGHVIDGGGGLVGPPPGYPSLYAVRDAADPAATLAGILDGERAAALERMRSYLLAQRALTTLPDGSDLPL